MSWGSGVTYPHARLLMSLVYRKAFNSSARFLLEHVTL